ncbi:MAG: hypothetical protein HOH33_11765 [Verrucomicrobia bacterium]|nr:hypothetical protein [Verrucomicrobiota bacterium]
MPETILKVDESYFIHRPRLIPDSNLVLCSKVSGTKSEIIVVDSQNGDSRIVVQDAMAPTYLQSGHLLYLRNGNLYGSEFDPKLASLVGRSTLIEQAVASERRFITASYAISDHGVLAFRKGGFIDSVDLSFVWMDMTGNISPASSARGPYRRFRLSSDGSKIAVMLPGVNGNGSSVGIIDLGSDTFDTLHDSLGVLEICLWTPDGDYVYFTRKIDEKHGIYKAQLYSTQEAELIYQGDERMLALDSITPNGKHLILVQVSESSDRDIMKLSASGDGKIEKLFGEDGHDGQNRIYATPYEGQFKRMPVSSGHGAWPYWHPKKKLIYYLGDSGMMEVEYDSTLDQFERKGERLLFEYMDGVILSDFFMDPKGEIFLVKQQLTGEPDSDHLTLITGLHTLLEQKLGNDSN